MILYNQVNTAVLERSDKMPPGCKFRKELEANFGEDEAISQWSLGFMLGHDWLADVWNESVPESMDNECGSSTMILSFFASRKLAEFYFLETTTTPRHRRPKKSFTEFADVVRRLFPSALASYAHLGRTISEVMERDTRVDH
jgi:hypothetical protein